MSPRVHIFVTQRARHEAVDRIMVNFLKAHQLRPIDRQQPTGVPWLSPAHLPLPPRISAPRGRPEGNESTPRPESHRLLLFERLVLVYVAALTAVIVAGNLLR
jgi:hypothetical protein